MNLLFSFVMFVKSIPAYSLFAWRLVSAIPLWLAYMLISLVLDAIGLFVVPIAICYGGCMPSPIYSNTIYNAPRWLWLWGNDEEGYDSENSWKMLPTPTSFFLHMYMWAAIRNPTSNLRFIKSLHPPQRGADVRWLTLGKFTLVWQGILTRLIWNNANRVNGTGSYFSIGWKYEPEAQDAEGWQQHGQGFSTRWVRK